MRYGVIILLACLLVLGACKGECNTDADCKNRCGSIPAYYEIGKCDTSGLQNRCDYLRLPCGQGELCHQGVCLDEGLIKEQLQEQESQGGESGVGQARGSEPITCVDRNKGIEFTVVSACKTDIYRTVPKCTDTYPFYSTKELQSCIEEYPEGRCSDPNVRVSEGRKYYDLDITEREFGAYCLDSALDLEDSVDDLQSVTVLS